MATLAFNPALQLVARDRLRAAFGVSVHSPVSGMFSWMTASRMGARAGIICDIDSESQREQKVRGAYFQERFCSGWVLLL